MEFAYKICAGGAVAGLVLGFVLGGVLGALGAAMAGAGLGLIADQLLADDGPRTTSFKPDEILEKVVEAPRPPPQIDLGARSAFIAHLVGLLTEMARCDGVIRREEIRIIRSFFEQSFTLTEQDMELVKRLLREALNTHIDLDETIDAYGRDSKPADRLLFLQALYEVALGDGELVQVEQKLINKICADLCISEQDHRTIRGLFFDEPSSADDYALLGVEPGADDAELKRAFRGMAGRHHPDKVAHLGADAAAMAGRRFAEIKLAYERIRQARAVG